MSDEDFQTNWVKIQSISKIVFELKITRLMDNVMTFIDINVDHFLKKDIKDLNELNDLTDGRLMNLMSNQCKAFKILKERLKEIKSLNELSALKVLFK